MPGGFWHSTANCWHFLEKVKWNGATFRRLVLSKKSFLAYTGISKLDLNQWCQVTSQARVDRASRVDHRTILNDHSLVLGKLVFLRSLDAPELHASRGRQITNFTAPVCMRPMCSTPVYEVTFYPLVKVWQSISENSAGRISISPFSLFLFIFFFALHSLIFWNKRKRRRRRNVWANRLESLEDVFPVCDGCEC